MSRLVALFVCIGLAPSAPAFPIIFDNITPNGGLLFNSGDSQPSQLDHGFEFDAGVADDFSLPPSSDGSGDWRVTDVHWYGRFVTGLPAPIDSFNIIFWPDAGGRPAGSNAAGLPPKYSDALAVYNNVPATASPSGGGSDNFTYDATLPSALLAQDGVKYWVEVQANINYPPLWVMEVTLNTRLAHPHYGWTLFGTAFWTASPAEHDAAFTLGGVPVPEPASTVLLFGLAVTCGGRRRAIFPRRAR